MSQIEQARAEVNEALEQGDAEAAYVKNEKLDRLIEQYLDARSASEDKR